MQDRERVPDREPQVPGLVPERGPELLDRRLPGHPTMEARDQRVRTRVGGLLLALRELEEDRLEDPVDDHHLDSAAAELEKPLVDAGGGELLHGELGPHESHRGEHLLGAILGAESVEVRLDLAAVRSS